MRMRSTVLILIFSVSAFFANGQAANTTPYPNGSSVCFIGNSITNNGEYFNNLWLYYATRFPKERITFYNCGISGDVAASILNRMDKDILIHNPTHAVMMVGMNDVKRNLYGKGKDNASSKQEAFDTYSINTEKALLRLKEKTDNIILLKPSIYDQTAKIPAENNFGVNDALQQYGTYLSSLSNKYGTGLVDFQTVMLRINKQEQEKNPEFTLVGSDRVHPMSAGHFVMTYQFLKDTKAPKYVSKISIGKDLIQSQNNSFNCKIEKLQKNKETQSFECLEESLPFPVKESASNALKWVPFQEDFNQQILQVDDLAEGNYLIYIDDNTITTTSAAALKAGINLALYNNTPQYVQALKVVELLNRYRNSEAIIRGLRFVEFNHLADLKDQTDLKAVEKHLASKLETLKAGGHYEFHVKQFAKYIEKKATEGETLKMMTLITNAMYKVNQPKKHVFKIVKQ